MPFTQIKDILQRAIEFHQQLSDFYKKIEDVTEKQSVSILVDYMSRHEKILKNQLSQVTEEQAKQIKEEWVKYEPDFAASCCFDKLKIDQNTGVDDVIDTGLMLNQCLINLYHQMAEIAPTDEIKQLFNNLEVLEIGEKKRLARIRGM